LVHALLEAETQAKAKAREQKLQEMRNIGHQLSLLVDLELRKGSLSNQPVVPGTPNEDD
jgi:hypothetical protein